MNRYATCPVCSRCVHVRLDGALRLHRDQTRKPCDGGGTDLDLALLAYASKSA